MARVFANQELVLGIAKGFIGNLYPRDDFLYVQTFSQVCHATRGPALDFWWHTQYSLYHILRTFGDAVQYTNIAPRKRHISLARPFQDMDWEQFRFYASKIRVLSSQADTTIGSEPSTLPFDIDEGLLKALTARGQLLFPNLERLVWPLEGIEESFPPNLILPLFVPPRLKSFRGIGEEESQLRFADATMACLSEKKPPLDTFCLVDEYERNWDECEIILDAIKNTVRRLEYSNVPEDDLYKLAELPQLERVLIPLYNMSETDVDDFFQKVDDTTVHPFRTLKALLLRCDGDLSIASYFLKAWNWGPGLEEVPIDLPNPTDDDALDGPSISQIVHAITQLPHAATRLHTVHLTGARAYAHWVEETLVGSASLLPLLSFAHLQHVVLGAEACWDLDDYFVADAARAWPRLRTLDLGCAGRWPVGRKPAVGLVVLARLAQWCVYLEVLRIRVNALDWPSGVFYRRGLAKCWALRHLDVGSSPIAVGLTERVAMYILDIFPLVLGIAADDNDIDEDNIAMWGVPTGDFETFPMLWGTVWGDVLHAQMDRYDTFEYEVMREDAMIGVRRHFPNGRPRLLEFF